MTTPATPPIPTVPPAPPAQPPAQPPAPATPPPPIPPAAQPVTFVSTGDAALDMATAYFTRHGVQAGDLAMTSAANGDFSVLRAVLQEKGAEGADAYVAIAEQAHGRKAAQEKAQAAARDSVLHDAMGGAENWLTVKAFIAEQATPEELAQINAALNAGGLQAKATAKYLRDAYEKASGASLSGQTEQPDPVGAATSRPSSAAAAASAALSPDDFRAEVKRLVATHGATGAYHTEEYRKAVARRQAYRG